MPNKSIQYWLFQSNPKVFLLKQALAADAIDTFAIVSHKKSIQKGDRIILWQTGKDAGCYALATVLENPAPLALSEKEKSFFVSIPNGESRVPISIDYNLWNRPITKDILPNSPYFLSFYAGIPGTNFKATAAQFQELVNIIEHFDMLQETSVDYQVNKSLSFPLNAILQGPPGTGKTYQTVNYALSIIEDRPLKELSIEPRTELRKRFESYQEEGRIQFITFHQSYTYEDFVEGIKPIAHEGQILYGIEHGIFKQICMDARRCLMEAISKYLPSSELEIEFNHLYSAFLDYLKSKDFSAFETPTERRILLHKVLRFGNLSVRQDKSFSPFTIRKNKLQKIYQHWDKVEEQDFQPDWIRSLIGDVNTNAYWGIFRELKHFEQNWMAKELEEIRAKDTPQNPIDIKEVSNQILQHCRKYVLIIDEINRGNIPAIFGELISLIESDKREGKAETIKTILPYSKELFAVPPNLYLLGTMNTSDRSVEKIDIALRRRFSFIEVLPQPSLLRPAIEAGVDLERLLDTINQRVDILLGKEYLIGHAYLMDVFNLDHLIELFDKKLIPLLEEYFFGDYEKIRLVLGSQFFEEEHANFTNLFANHDEISFGELSLKRKYTLKAASEWREIDFIRIYDSQYEA